MKSGELGQHMKVMNTLIIVTAEPTDARNLVSTAVYSVDPALSFTILVNSLCSICVQLLGGSNLAATDKN